MRADSKDHRGERTGARSSHWFIAAAVAMTVVLVTGCPDPPDPDPDPDPTPGAALAPGLNVSVISIVVPDDRRPVVTLSVTDDADNPIPLHEFTDARFILAFLATPTAGNSARYSSYTTRTEDPDGMPDSGDEAVQADYDGARFDGIVENSDGTYTYTFETALPADYDPSASHQLSGQFRRFSNVHMLTYVANLVEPFRPDGNTDVATRDIVSTESCNNCHTRLAEHGGVRREVGLCITCHNPDSTDANTGNTLDFPVLIHKIHRGADLPSVKGGEPFQIVGFGDSVHDYSTVEFPQDLRNCTVCHSNAAQADLYMNGPNRAGCASCHDRTWFGNSDLTPAGFTDHPGGMPVDESACSTCHAPPPLGNGVAPVDFHHTLPTESEAAPGLFLDITNVAAGVTKQGEGVPLEITFTATDSDGNLVVDLSELDTVAATVAYPATEYEVAIRESIANGSDEPDGVLVNVGGGTYTYSFAADLPSGTGDTFAVAMEGRRLFDFRGEETRQGTATNGQTFFTLDGSEPRMRREIVDEAKCNLCHHEIRHHSSRRTGVSYCVMCHNVNLTDEAGRPAEELPPVTANFKDLIHRIHTGEELDNGYVVYGGSGRPHDFSEVRFPGDRRECLICHLPGTYDELPLPSEALSTVVTLDGGDTLVSDVLPERASCTSCHDSGLTNLHAMLNTDFDARAESCAVCHGAGAEFAVADVHMREP